MELSDNTILITGATSGIGWALAEEFHKRGNTVIACGRRKDNLKELSAAYPGIITKVSDIGTISGRQELAQWCLQNYPDVNVLFNNAGVQFAGNFLHGLDAEKVQTEININFTAYVHLASLFTAHFVKKPKASIINVSSGLAFCPLAFMPVYCATKAAVHSFTMSLRWQLKDTSVQVIELAPPPVDTELGRDRWAPGQTSHGGLAVDEFLKETMEALGQGLAEAPIANAKHLRAQGEQFFEQMNSRH